MKSSFVKILTLVILIFFLILPFTNGFNFFDSEVEKITSDLRFYEINTCSIPLFQFLNTNLNVVYQDHYKLRANNYSSIICHGTITGIDQIGYEFYISIGTNTFINIMSLSLISFLVISLTSNKSNEISLSKIRLYLLSSIFTSLVFTFGIFSEKRFYSKSFYIFEFYEIKQYFKLFFMFLFISLIYIYFLESRKEKIIYLIPFLYLIPGVVSGTSFSIFLILFFNSGFIYLYNNFYRHKNSLFIYFIFVTIWSWVSSYYTADNNYFLDPDKTIGLAMTSYDVEGVVYSSILILFVFFGIYRLSSENFESIDFSKILKNLSLTSILVMIVGVVSANFPFLNFFFYYFSGQHKMGTLSKNLLSYNEWGEFIAWRGFLPSAETAGELFALNILLYFLIKGIKPKTIYEIVTIILLIFGLIISNNRAAMFLLIAIISFKIILDQNKKLITPLIIVLVFSLIYIIGFQNFTYSIDFATNKIISVANSYSLEGFESSGLKTVNTQSRIFRPIFSIISVFAFLINRSEMWGIFFARYNPTILEALFGNGPFHLAKHYGETPIVPTSSFLLPHSSLLNSILFFGLIFSIYLIYKLGQLLYFLYIQKKINLFLICLFIFINLIKSDSILYIGPFVFFTTLFVIAFNELRSSK